MVVGLVLAAGGASGQGLSPASDAQVVSDAAVEASLRGEAARRLLMADNNGARQAVLDLLKPSEGAGLTEPQRLLLGEIARLSWAPSRLGKPLRNLLSGSTGDDRLAVVAAMASVRTPESANALIELVSQSQNSREREAVFAALIRMTGRADLGENPAAWRGWLSRVEFLDEASWQRTIAESLAARADQLARSENQVLDRLVREKRDRFRAIPLDDAAARSNYIATLLADPAGAVRMLGVDLANDELANARSPGPSVSEAALAMLSDPEARFRRLGADLLEKLAPEGVGGRVNDALIRETDPAAAAALLGAARRWPQGRVIPVVLRWLEDGPAARTAALSALVKLDREGLLTDEAHVRRAMQAIRGLQINEIGTAGVQLLARRGGEADLPWVTQLLEHQDLAIRLAAAAGLAERPECVDAVVAAAGKDASLFTAAATTLMRHRRTGAGLASLVSLPAPSPEARLERIKRMAAALPPETVCAVGCKTADSEAREAILSRLEGAAWWWVDQRAWASAASSPVWLRGLVELARTRLELGRPAEALEALGPVDSIAMEPAVTAPVRTVAMIWLNRLDEAASLPVGAEVWVSALERIVDLPHAAAALARFDALYPTPVLDDGLRTRVAWIREQLQQLARAKAPEQAAPPAGP